MFCPNCGTTVNEGTNCPNCGAPLTNAQPVQVTGGAGQTLGNPSQVLVFGILGLAFGLGGGILGIIFSIIGLTKAKSYIAAYGDVSNQVRTGKKLATAGLIVAIIMTICWIIIIAAAANGVNEVGKEVGVLSIN